MSDDNNYSGNQSGTSDGVSPGFQTADETNLDGMDVASAKEYVLSYISTLKNIQKEMKTLTNELSLWKEREKFAAERGREDLRSAATLKAQEVTEKLIILQSEEKDLAGKVKALMENLKNLQAGFTPSVDAERLQAELEMLTGGPDKVAEELKEEETLAELEKLKRKMKDDGQL